MYEEAKEAILKSSESSSVYIGTDSIRFKQKGIWKARYTTAVVLHIDSCRGAKLFHNSVELPDYGNLKQRLMTEVGYAIEAFDSIVDVIGNRACAIHLDLNSDPKHKSSVAVKEALGYVFGSTGLHAYVKPYGTWAASTAADHCVRGKLH